MPANQRPGLNPRPLLLLTLIVSALSLRADLRDDLAGYWPVDEDLAPITRDATTNHNDGALQNFPIPVSWSSGRVGQSLHFGGPSSSQFVLVENYPKLSHVTVSAWVLAESRPTWASILKNWGGSQTGQFHFGLNSSDGGLSCYLTLDDGSQAVARENSALPTQSWQHVAFTHDGLTLRLFRNGVEVVAAPAHGSLMPSVSSALGMGVKLNNAGTAPDTGAPGFWHGRLDEVALWLRALAPAEIEAIYQAGLSGLGIFDAKSGPQVTGSGIRLSEFMAANTRTLEDDFGEDSDWIELHNDTTNVVDLAGWSLTDSPDRPSKWSFPSTNLGPGKFLVVFASGRDRRQPGAPLHTSFRLAAEGEYLALSRPDGTPADVFVAGREQLPDISFGYPPDYDGSAGFLLQPTPGAANLGSSMLLGPIISEVTPAPMSPRTNDQLRFVCRIEPIAAPPAQVTLHVRFMFQPELAVPMRDDGLHGDGTAGDYVYGASVNPGDFQIPPSPGTMLRWRFTATDQAGNNSRLPIAAQSRSAEYLGTVFQPDDFSTNSVPVLHFFVEDPAKADSDSGTTCSLYYNGQFRDRTQVRMRGGSARYWPRKSYKFDLNPGEKIVIRPGTLKVGEFNLNSPYTDKSYVRSVLASEFLLAAGIPAPEEFHLRVLRNASFHSLGIYVEQMDDTFLERHALDPNGSYYKAQGDPLGTYEKKSRPSEGEADLQDFLAGLDNSGPNLEGFLFDQVNLPNVVNYMATVAILQNIDASDKNHYLHRDTLDTREWRILPWDLDLTFGPDYLNTDTMVYSLCDVAGVHCPSHPFIGARPYLLHPGKHHPLLEAVVGNTRAREMLLRRIRTLRDDFLVTGFFENRIEALFTKLAPDVLFDRQTWKANSHFPGKSYTFRQALDRLKTEYLVPRTAFLARTNIVGIGPAMPSSQDAEVSLGFGRIESGVHLHNLEQQFVELVNSNPTAVDISGWQLRGVISFSFPPGTVVPSGGSLFAVHNTAAFRSRAVEPRGGMGLFVQGDYAGSLGAMGGPISLRDSSGRLVSEILFPPVQPSILSLNFDSGSVRLRARGQPAVSYVIERKASLLEQAWTAVGSKSADSTGAIEFTDGIETKDAAFYRLRVQ